VQAQDVGYFLCLPFVSRQPHDAGSSVAHDVVSALPVIQDIGFFGRYTSYVESHNDSHLATLSPKVKISDVKQH
jgi:hypothetical protein